ncbi:MAG: DUF945 family protein [Candidatus Marithrix sp.]
MKHIFIVLLMLSVPMIGLADDISTQSSSPATQNVQPDIIHLKIKHRINDGNFLQAETSSLTIKRFQSKPSLLLKLVRDSLSKHLQVLPVKINTELDLLLDKTKLSTISIATNIDQDGKGISDVILPAYKFSNNETAFAWNGLKSHLTFTDNFTNLIADTKFAKLNITKKDKLFITLDGIDIYSVFDADLQPSKLQVNIPSLQVQENDNTVNLQNLIAKIDIKKIATGLEIGNLTLQLKHIDFTENNITTNLNNLHLVTDTQEQNDVINFNLQANTDQIELSEAMGSGLGNIMQTGNISLHNLDTSSLLILQKKFHRLHDNPMAAFIMFSALMEVAPNFLAKSPEIKLNQLLIKTAKGNLQGDFRIGLDGSKAKRLLLPVLFNALTAEANLTINKKLLEQAMINHFQQTLDNKKSAEDAKVAAEKQIKTYLASKILVEIADNYKLIASFNNGKLLVNGQEMSLSDLTN